MGILKAELPVAVHHHAAVHPTEEAATVEAAPIVAAAHPVPEAAIAVEVTAVAEDNQLKTSEQ